MEELKVWLIFLCAIVSIICLGLAVVLGGVGWIVGVTDFYKRNNLICAGVALIIPPFALLNGFMFVFKKHTKLQCYSNYEIFQVVIEHISSEIALRKKKSSLDGTN